MRFQVCCETGFSRLKMIMTKMRNNLLVVTLDALMMFINGPSLEPDVPSPTIELSELCKLGYLHWTNSEELQFEETSPPVTTCHVHAHTRSQLNITMCIATLLHTRPCSISPASARRTELGSVGGGA